MKEHRAELAGYLDELRALATPLSPRPNDPLASVGWQLSAVEAHGQLAKTMVLASAALQEHFAIGVRLSELRRDLCILGQAVVVRGGARERKGAPLDDPFVERSPVMDRMLEQWRSSLSL